MRGVLDSLAMLGIAVYLGAGVVVVLVGWYLVEDTARWFGHWWRA